MIHKSTAYILFAITLTVCVFPQRTDGKRETEITSENGQLWVVGNPSRGHLGQGPATTPTSVPIELNPAGRFTNLFCREFNLFAIDSSGDLYCWGPNEAASCGTGTNDRGDLTVPAKVALPAAGAIQAFYTHSYGGWVMKEDEWYGWGRNQGHVLGLQGTVAADALIDSPTPIPWLNTRGSVEKISGGYGHTVAIVNGGNVQTWGSNVNGQLSRTTAGVVDEIPAATTPPISNAVDACAIGDRTHILLDNGVIRSAGKAGASLGLGDPGADVAEFLTVVGVENVEKMVCGNGHTIAIDTSGDVWGWGNSAQFQLGQATSPNTPVKLNHPLGRIVGASASLLGTILVDADGYVAGMGDSSAAGTGLGSLLNSRIRQSAQELDFFTDRNDFVVDVCFTSNASAYLAIRATGLSNPAFWQGFWWFAMGLSVTTLITVAYKKLGVNDTNGALLGDDPMGGLAGIAAGLGGGVNEEPESPTGVLGFDAMTVVDSKAPEVSPDNSFNDRAAKAGTLSPQISGMLGIVAPDKPIVRERKGSKSSKGSRGSSKSRKGSKGSKGSRGSHKSRKNSKGSKGGRGGGGKGRSRSKSTKY